MREVITNNEKETYSLGQKLARSCRGGEIFAISGDLGAGKTRLVQGLANGLGVKSKVNSPTFNILKLYRLKGTVKQFCHIDTYRLKGENDLIGLGVEEFFDSEETVTAIEWADKVLKILPARAQIVNITALSENQRLITFF